jgi:uncharacterized protein YbjT (DUF2867 family)
MASVGRSRGAMRLVLAATASLRDAGASKRSRQMPRIVVVGAGGRTGMLIVKALLERKDQVVATIRSPRQMAPLVKLGAETVLLDLVASAFEDWVRAFKGADAVIFAAGSATGESSALDRKGTLRTVRAAERAGVKRYLTISSIGASTGLRLSGEWATPEMVDYYKQKRAANKLLTESPLQWTILEPGELTDGRGTGKVKASIEAIKEGKIARADVAAVMASAVHERKTVGKVFQLVGGTIPIPEAIAKAMGK